VNHVVISFPTIMDGTVLRWYRSERAAEYSREFLSASRNGITTEGVLDARDRPILEQAWIVHEALAADRAADVSVYITHHRQTYGGAIEVMPR